MTIKPIATKTTTVKRILEWDSAHRVLRHESKCATLHGHRYRAELTVTADELDDCDRIIDFGVLKTIVGGWIDAHWDHATLLNEDDIDLRTFCANQAFKGHRPAYAFTGEPTAETIAAELFDRAEELLFQANTGIRVDVVEVWETPNCSATVSRDVDFMVDIVAIGDAETPA